MSSVRAEPNTNAIYEAAERYVAMGISVIPIKTGTKEPPTGFRWGEFVHRMADASERYQWFVEEGHQLAIIAGSIVPLDYDSASGFPTMALQYPVLRTLPRVRTGSGKHHVWVKPERPTAKYNTTTPDGGRLEIRAGTHYTLAPPSLHPNGNQYTWEVEPDRAGIPTVALESIGLKTVERSERGDGEPLDTEGTPLTEAEIHHVIRIVTPHWVEYARHDLCLYLSGWLAGHSVPEADAAEIILTLAEDHGDDDRLREFKRTIRDTYRKARAGVTVGGWAKLNDRDAPLISPGAATELDLLMRGRNPVFTFDVAARVTEESYPYIIDVADLLKEPDEPEKWVIDGILRDATVSLVVGPPKTFKSFFAQELSVAIATGTPMFGMFHVAEPATVVYVQEESARRYVRKRYAGILKGRGIHPETVRGNLYTVTNQHFRLDDAEHIQRLVTEVIEAYEPSVVILDPLREMHWQDENKAETMMPLLRVLKDLRDTYSVSIIVVHHNNKNPEAKSPAESIRGSTAIWAAMDAGIFIGTTEAEDHMKVSITLKEGGQVAPFLYGIESDGDAITFEVVELDGSKRQQASISNVLEWARGHGGWWSIEDVIAAIPASERTLRTLIRDAVKAQQIKQQTAKFGKKLYAHLEVDDDEPTF